VIAAANPLRGVKHDSAYVASILKSIEGPIVLVGHSYGTFVSTWFIKYRADMIAATVLIDPVCFMVSVNK